MDTRATVGGIPRGRWRLDCLPLLLHPAAFYHPPGEQENILEHLYLYLHSHLYAYHLPGQQGSILGQQRRLEEQSPVLRCYLTHGGSAGLEGKGSYYTELLEIMESSGATTWGVRVVAEKVWSQFEPSNVSSHKSQQRHRINHQRGLQCDGSKMSK